LLYPYALAQNDNIDANLNFVKLVDVINGNNSFLVPAMFSAIGSSMYGNWKGVTDKYVPLEFSPDGTNLYFGWVRCDVAADGSSMTIKDYAYNTVEGQGMFAGQGNPTGIGNTVQTQHFNVYGYEGVANIFVNDGNIDGTSVTVTNMIGQTMVKQVITDRNTKIDLNNFGKGIYMVTINRGDEVFSKKISFR